MIEKLATWFKDLGFHVEVIEVESGKHNMIARMGEGEGGLLLAGHSDTVPFDEGRWSFDPHKLTEKDNRFYGLGTADMKGFFAFIYEAVKKWIGASKTSRFTYWPPVMKKPQCSAQDTSPQTRRSSRITASLENPLA